VKTPDRILVTGANGFIGRRALAPLLKLGFEVHAASWGPQAQDVPLINGVQCHAVDLMLPIAARGLMEKVQPACLLHFAWYAEHGKFWDSPLNLPWLSATLSLLQEFERAGGKRFVGAGTCAEYDWNGDLFSESKTPLRPATLYGAAKASAYLTGSAFSQTKNLSFAWGRIFNLFGPEEPPARIVPALIRSHLSGNPLNCSQGTQLRDFLPVSAVADAFAHICASDIQGPVNIGSGQGITLIELSEKISAAVGRKADVRFGAFRDSGPARLVPEIERLAREAGWYPPSIDPGLTETIDWWKSRL
jgi:nucleoside-diphosphate-sugar epimerase